MAMPLCLKRCIMHRIISILLIAALMLAFAACKPKSDEVKPTEAAVTDGAPAEQTPSPSEDTRDKVAVKVAQYAALVKPQIAQVAEAMKDTLSVDVYAEERALVMEYKYVNDTPVDVESLKTTISSTGETYLQTFDELKGFAGSDEVSVILRYIASDGTKILDYVIDKNFVPGEGAGIQQHYDSVEAFVASEEFGSTIGAASNSEIEVSAFVEDKDIVIASKLLAEYSEEELDSIKTNWLENMGEQADNAAKALMASMKLLVDDCEGYSFVYRLLDKEGNTVAEQKANID